MARSARRLARVAVCAAAVTACVPVGAGSGASSGGAPAPASGTPAADWRITTYEHLDLWLHGYALLSRDTAAVPLFARGYRERMQAQKARSNIYTELDANRDRLAARLATNPALVNGQFVPMYFTNFDEMQQVVSRFLGTGGSPDATNDPELRMQFAVLASAFPTAADREWLRLFVQSLADERRRFYDDYWRGEQARRAPVVQAVDSLWRLQRPKLLRYLQNTQQSGGELILSLPLDGEGRTITSSQGQSAVATEFPETPARAADALYVFVHEVAGAVANPAIADNITPAQQRSGIVAEYTARAAVRTGAMLLEKTAPELAPGYMRYYLRASGANVPVDGLAAAFAARFPLPDLIRDAIVRQLDTVLGGI